jgi:hypothetical protein
LITRRFTVILLVVVSSLYFKATLNGKVVVLPGSPIGSLALSIVRVKRLLPNVAAKYSDDGEAVITTSHVASEGTIVNDFVNVPALGTWNSVVKGSA